MACCLALGGWLQHWGGPGPRKPPLGGGAWKGFSHIGEVRTPLEESSDHLCSVPQFSYPKLGGAISLG